MIRKRLLLVLLLVSGWFAGYGLGAIASWEDTKGAQVTANILPLSEGTFHFTSSNCTDAAVGYGGDCHIYIYNDSSVLLTIDVITVTTVYPHLTVEDVEGVGWTIDPQKQDNIFWGYISDALAEPGEVTFNVEITCSGP